MPIIWRGDFKMSITLTTKLVVDADGNIDQERSLAAFRSQVATRIAERQTEQAQIAEVVGAIFEENKGASINMPALRGLACAKLQAQPDMFKTLSNRVADYVRENSQGKVVDGVAERPESLFLITKGSGGGVSVRADRPVKSDTEA